MTSVFRAARSELPRALAAKISFYRRELFGPAIPFRRFDMRTHFRFPRSTVFLMLVILAVVVLTIVKASGVAGDRLGSVWPSLISVLAFMVLSMCSVAAVVWGILHTLRRSGVHRLQNVQGYSVESNGNR
jgi:hypothetical protein